jgi:hypothetical protein
MLHFWVPFHKSRIVLYGILQEENDSASGNSVLNIWVQNCAISYWTHDAPFLKILFRWKQFSFMAYSFDEDSVLQGATDYLVRRFYFFFF